MLSKQGFDLWANDYDQTVQVSENNDLYPFAGYKKIINTIFNEVMQQKQSKVLDIGFGTAVLASKLYDHGHELDGLDFSAKMIAIAQAKMPMANLLEWDISNGLPENIVVNQYDAIISTYTLHHLTDEDKLTFITNLLPLLSEGGKIFIGDIAFQTRVALQLCRDASLAYWDDDEFYFVAAEMTAALKNECTCEFYPLSHCGGVFVIAR
ncbi:class I SAM-dependent methyltransferase [Sporosarcina sp. FSL K6-3457]|uniref:class I SAM-dependent methyltransferase n=1 Tax=Sporosarcina sp. FSL K6-3457 TaxID=2978204 RepID=UPI0030FC556C